MLAPFNRILIPVDFTDDADAELHSGLEIPVEGGSVAVAPASVRAIELGARSLADGGELWLVHVTPTYEVARVYSGGTGMGLLGAGDIAAVHASARKASEHVLKALAERTAPDLVCKLVVRPGVALQVILEETQRHDIELIIIAASGRSRVARFFLGSTADRVIRESSCPVMVIPSSS